MKFWKSTSVALVVLSLILSGGTVANARETVSSVGATPSSTVAHAATPALATASTTGQYEWVCVLANGSSYSMVNGEPTTNCKGSYLQKYLNGVQLQVISLTGGGVQATATITCVLAVTAGVLLVFTPGGGLVWLARTAARNAIAASNPCRA
jgi:hypothetical protein